MKKIIVSFNIKIALLIFAISMASCQDFLDVVPKDQITDISIWQSTQNADLFLNNIYSGLPGPFSLEENYTDNSMSSNFTASDVTLFDYTPNDAPNYWNHYANIRSCNLFIENVTASNLEDSWKKQRLAEARFLRAYYYQILWTHYAGVPIITQVLNRNTQGDEIFRARNTDDQTFKFITDECAAIADDLPVTPEAGRAGKGAALTLKGWCELFNASPLKNPSNDQAKWALAATTNKEVIDLAAYDLFPDYNTMFFEDNNNNIEVIFDKQYLGGTPLGGSREGIWGPTFVGAIQMTFGGNPTPTQELVDEYVMSNGLPITDPASGYDPQNPYVNREKRFYQTIVYDGSLWMGTEMVMKQGVGGRNATDLSGSGDHSNTGYYMRKGINPKYTVAGDSRLSSASFIIFRYAEVLLSYAEAQNEAVGPDESVYEAINKVRDRSELTSLPVGLSQEEMRAAIHRERRVELAFEEKYWFDLLRWKKAEVNLNGTLHAMLIEKENDKWVYKVIPAVGGSRKFYADKNYLLPIPQQAMDQNPQLVQNPNY